MGPVARDGIKKSVDNGDLKLISNHPKDEKMVILYRTLDVLDLTK